jgi:hypothetical protein
MSDALSSAANHRTAKTAAMKPASVTVTVVLLGTFKPGALLLPNLVQHKAIGKGDAEQSSYEALLRDQVVDVKLPWARLVCIPERLSIETPLAPYVRAADLAAKCVREVAGGSLVTKVGLNVTCRYGFQSVKARDEFGQRLSPISAWGALGAEVAGTLGATPDKLHGGLVRAAIRLPREHKTFGGHLDLHVEAGDFSSGTYNVLLQTNDHFEPIGGDIQATGLSERMFSEALIEVIENEFDASIKKALDSMDSLINGS